MPAFSNRDSVYDDLTARENLVFAATMLGLEPASSGGRVGEVLDEVGLAEDDVLRVRGFSAGMRRRLALGRVLLARPSLVLLDEPFAALDPAGIQLMEGLLDRWRRSGVTALVAAHVTEHIAAHADATVQLQGGAVVRVTGDGVVAWPPAREPAAPRAVEVAP